MWFDGYWWWVCGSGQSKAPVACALWSVTSGGTGVLIQSATTTSGSLTPGQWNWIPLAAPVPIAIGSPYIAAVAVDGSFPCTNYQFGAGDPHSGGMADGPLVAYSDQSGSLPGPYGIGQGGFTTGGSNPTLAIPNGADKSANFWVDVQVSDAAPSGYAGSYRLWPNKWDADPKTGEDAPVDYVVATEVALAQECTLNNVWYFSPPATQQLATQCDLYDISTRQSVASITSPSWSGAAGSGWVSAAFPAGTAVPAGKYKVAVYNSAAAPDGWSAKDDSTNYWDTGVGGNGIRSGPISAPGLATASPAYIHDNDGAQDTPPYSYPGGAQEPGQCTFAIGGPQYPYLYVDGKAQNYWVDLEVTPSSQPTPTPTPTSTATSTPTPTPTRGTQPPVNSGAFFSFLR